VTCGKFLAVAQQLSNIGHAPSKACSILQVKKKEETDYMLASPQTRSGSK